MQDILAEVKELIPIFPLIVAITGEIGNNSFDPNLGNWPDIRHFLWYDIHKRNIVLADRGLGILTTLKRVKPELSSDVKAVKLLLPKYYQVDPLKAVVMVLNLCVKLLQKSNRSFISNRKCGVNINKR